MSDTCFHKAVSCAMAPPTPESCCWVVERTVSWLAGCRRLHRRYERKADHFLAFVGIAAALICHRRLTGPARA